MLNASIMSAISEDRSTDYIESLIEDALLEDATSSFPEKNIIIRNVDVVNFFKSEENIYYVEELGYDVEVFGDEYVVVKYL